MKNKLNKVIISKEMIITGQIIGEFIIKGSKSRKEKNLKKVSIY